MSCQLLPSHPFTSRSRNLICMHNCLRETHAFHPDQAWQDIAVYYRLNFHSALIWQNPTFENDDDALGIRLVQGWGYNFVDSLVRLECYLVAYYSLVWRQIKHAFQFSGATYIKFWCAVNICSYFPVDWYWHGRRKLGRQNVHEEKPNDFFLLVELACKRESGMSFA